MSLRRPVARREFLVPAGVFPAITAAFNPLNECHGVPQT
jgi:hypothetical protein